MPNWDPDAYDEYDGEPGGFGSPARMQESLEEQKANERAREAKWQERLQSHRAVHPQARQLFEDLIHVFGFQTAMMAVVVALELRAKQSTTTKKYFYDQLAQRIRNLFPY